MTKRISSLVLALVMLLQIFVPQITIAQEYNKAPSDKQVQIGLINGNSYDSKLMLELNRLTASSRRKRSAEPGTSLFGYFEDGQEPKDEDKLKYHGEVKAKLTVKGLDGNAFQWNEVFGTEEVHLRFIQINDEDGYETGVERVLNITQAGTYTWTDGEGNPAELPLFDNNLKPLTYEVKIDEEVSDNVKLLTARLTTTDNALPTFEKPDAEGRIKYHLTLEIGLQQVASSKFVSEWHTAVEESGRPQIKGTMTGSMDTGVSKTINFNLPTNDNDKVLVRTNNRRDKDKLLTDLLYKTPATNLVETNANGLTFDTTKKTVNDGNHTYKYDFTYDVINGGKLTMTEIIPVTFDANGGKFANFTAPDTEIKIVKEVEYEKDLTDKPADPKKDLETFKGWATEAKGAPLSDEEFKEAIKNVREAKTFYAIWDNNDIVAEEIVVGESYKTDPNSDTYKNDLGPSYFDLKKQVKVKDDKGNFVPIPNDATLSILDETGKGYVGESTQLKRYLYKKVKEKDDGNKPSRIETVKAKVKYANGTSKTVDIPIKVIKNIYEAKTLTEKTFYVPENYVKVTLDPTTKAQDPQKTYYYVNPGAQVAIPGEDPTGTGNNVFTKWTMPWNPNPVEIKLSSERYQFKNETTITAQYVSDVIPQTGTEKPKEVPGDFVLVEFKPGEHGTIDTTEITKYWVNPKAGKKLSDITHPTVTANEGWKHTGWDKKEDTSITEALEVTAQYLEKVLTKEPTEHKDEYVKVEFTQGAHGTIANTETKAYWVLKDVEVTLTAPQVKANDNYQQKDGTDAWSPKVQKSYSADATHAAQYNYIGKDVVPAKDDGTKPDNTPDDFIKVIVQLTDKAKVVGPSNEELTGDAYTKAITKTFWVAPNKEVTIPVSKPIGKDVPVDESNPKAYTWNFTKWTSDEVPFRTWTDGITAKFTNDTTTITAQYEKSITDQGTVVAEEITVHESFKDGNTWVNNFIDTEATEAILKGALKVNGGALPNDATVVFLDDADKAYTDEAALKAALYDKLQEKDDGNNPRRIEKVKAKVTFKNGEVQTVDIPIKVIKNIYEAKTLTEKPFYVPDGYVKVTVDPTTKAQDPQKYFYYVNPDAKVVIPGSDPVGVDGNTFTKWLIDGTDTEYKLKDKPRHQFSTETTIKAQYSKDVIPQEGDTKPEGVPDNFVKVTFAPTENGTMEGAKIFWVNPTKEVTIPVKDPVGKQYFTFKEWKIGENADGAVYTPSTPKKFEEATTITATYDEAKNIIPYNPSEPITRPEGYVRVTFAADPGLKLTEQKAYYVKKNAGIKLGNAELVKPTYEAQTGYKFDKWDKEDSLVIEAADIVVTAKATPLADVVPKDNPQGGQNDKPDGYITVTFSTEANGNIKDSTETTKVVYVNPNKAVVLTPYAPEVTPKTGFEFADWDTQITKKVQYSDGETIKALYNELGDVIPQEKTDGSDKPAGYLTVTFDKGEHGELSGKTVYYVKPNKEVTVPAPTVTPKTGWKQKAGDDAWDKALTQTFTEDTKITAQYDSFDDIIPGTKEDGTPNVKPDGYVTVTFDKGEHGTLSGQTVYYVNPEADPVKTLANIAKPTVKAEVGYNFNTWNFADTKEITSDITVTAQYDPIADVIPKTTDDGTTNEKPDSYITVTFVKGDHGELEGNTVFYINPNKAVVLEGKAPKVTPNTGYKFASWDTQINKKIQYNDGDKITALYNELGDVIPQENPDGSDKPAGYLTVTFDKGEHGTLSGQTVYYVNPNKEVTVPAPDVKPNVGYEFEKWDKELTQTFAEDTTITAGYKALDNIIPQKNTDGSDKPDGYFTVTFKPDANGSLSGTLVYYVKPNVDIDFTNTANGITKKGNVGYTEDGGTWSPAIEKQQYTKDETYTFTFKALPDVIEDKPGNTKPDGYVTVAIVPTERAKDPTVKYYWVNPNKKVTIPATDPTPAKEYYKFIGWDKELTQTFKEYTAIYAMFEIIGEPTPGPGPGPGPSPWPPTPPTPGGPGGYYPGGFGYGGVVTKTEYKQRQVLRREVRYMQGFAGKFRPMDNLTRAEAAQILANALREDGYRYDPNYKLPYHDIKGDEWYSEAIRITTQADVFKGYDDGNFKPNKKISRAEWIATLRRFQYIDEAPGNFMKLRSDHWAISEVQAAYREGWLAIYLDGRAKFEYDKPITRQEVAAVSNRAFNRVLDKKFILDNRNNLINYSDINKDMWAYEDILCASNTFLHQRQGRYLAYEIGPKTYSINVKDALIEQDLFQRIVRGR